jgi:hypothetical protein
MLDKKLQLKDGNKIAVLYAPYDIAINAPRTSISQSDAVLIFTITMLELEERVKDLKMAAAASQLTWIAYPKAKQLKSDLNRDIIREYVSVAGLDTVRQVAIDDTWSALRLKLT